jgi:hypothetical protein
MPGTLPVGMDERSSSFTPSTAARIAQDVAREETLFMRALGDD